MVSTSKPVSISSKTRALLIERSADMGRTLRGLELAETGAVEFPNAPDSVLLPAEAVVSSARTGESYLVTRTVKDGAERTICTCKDFTVRASRGEIVRCKHIEAAAAVAMERREALKIKAAKRRAEFLRAEREFDASLKLQEALADWI